MADSPYILEGEVILREGESRQFAVTWDDFASISTNAGIEIYVNGSTDTATWVASNDPSVTGNTLNLPAFIVPSGTGGVTAVIEANMAVSGIVYKTGIVCRILKPGAER
jgi:hypothetical protein